MRTRDLPLAGAYIVELEPKADHRGDNTRLWCANEAADLGLATHVAQINLIRNHAAGTLRGFHYQRPPHAETKLFRVTRGAMYDVIVDLRPESPTFGEWTGVELSADRDELLFVPERFGQGFLTLTEDTEVVYQVTAFYTPGSGTGFRYDDPALEIDWPRDVAVISDQDRDWPPLDLAVVRAELTTSATGTVASPTEPTT